MSGLNPQPATRNPQLLLDLLLLAGIETFMMVFLDVRVLFYDTVPTGGDTASWQGVADHLLRVLLPEGRLTGWDLGNFCGYPNFSFYFLPPFLLAVLPSYLFGLPLTISLKLAISIGVFLLPVCTYLGLRAMNYRFPGPLVGAAASLLFLFNESYTMFGGNLLSTYTGEFSYMFAFSVFAYFIGSLHRGVEKETGAIQNGILLGLIGLSHLFVFIPAVCLLVYFFLAKGRLGYLLGVSVTAFGLMAFWILPLLAYRHPYTTPVYMIWQQFVSWRYTFLGMGLALLLVGPRLALAAGAGRARLQIPPTPPLVKGVDEEIGSTVCSDHPPKAGIRDSQLQVGLRESCSNGWGLGLLVFSGLFVFTLAYLGATYAVLGKGLFDTGIEITPLAASPMGLERALLWRPWILPFSLFLSLVAFLFGVRAHRSPPTYERFCLFVFSATGLTGLITAFFSLYAFMAPTIPDLELRAFFQNPATKAVLLALVLGPVAYLFFFHRPFGASILKAAAKADHDRFGMFLGLAFGCTVGYFAAHYLEVPDIRFLPPLLYVLLLIFFVDTLEPFWPRLREWRRAGVALLLCYGCVVTVLFTASKADYWFQYNNKGYEHRPGYRDFREANQYLRNVYPDALNAPRVGYEKSDLYGPYGGDRVFESLPLFSGRQTMEGIHYASSMAARFMAFLQTAYSKEVKTPRSYILSRLNPGALPAYFDLYNLSQLILMSDKGKEAIAVSPHFEKEASFGDISIYRYKDCDGRYVDVPRWRPLLLAGDDWVEDFFRWYKAGDHLDLLMVPEGYVKDEADRALLAPEVRSLQELAAAQREPLDRNDLRIETRLDHLRISFTTNKVGLPHLVKISYYPNWKVKGAHAVYPVSPHLMLVVPREKEVVLTYGRTPWDLAGMAITAATLLLLGLWMAGALLRPLRCHAALWGLSRLVVPDAAVRTPARFRLPLTVLVLLGACLLISGGAVSRNRPVRTYVQGYGEYKAGLDLLEQKRQDLARGHFEKAIEVMAPLVEARARHDHQDVIHCMLFTALCHEQLGRPGAAEEIYRVILAEYPYSRFVAEAHVKIGRLRRQGRDPLSQEGFLRIKKGDESGRVLVEQAIGLSQEALRLFQTALREDPYSVWADYAKQDIRQERDWTHRVEGMIRVGRE